MFLAKWKQVSQIIHVKNVKSHKSSPEFIIQSCAYTFDLKVLLTQSINNHDIHDLYSASVIFVSCTLCDHFSQNSSLP